MFLFDEGAVVAIEAEVELVCDCCGVERSIIF